VGLAFATWLHDNLYFLVTGNALGRIIFLFAISIAYSAVRYIAFAPQNLPNLPVYVVNKGVSMAAAFSFALAFWQQWRRNRGAIGGTEPSWWFRAGIFGAIWHIPMSLAILRPSYFKEFFDADSAGRMSFNGEAVFMFGALTAGGIYLLTSQQWTAMQRWWLSLATMSVLFAHTLCMGIARGLNINASHAYLPPMWLLSLMGIMLGAGFLLMCRPMNDAAMTEHLEEK
jgi:hypothetical protein